jgi:hypothetical protein
LEQEKEDNNSPIGDKHKYATDYGWLRLAAQDEDPPLQLNLLNEIKSKLKEYSVFEYEIRACKAVDVS